jgi:hypothetical protein
MMCLGPAVNASAEESAQRLAIRNLADTIKQILEKHGNPRVAVGAFTGSVDLAASGGPAVQRILAEELGNSGVRVDGVNFSFEISGRYQPVKHPDSKLNVIKLSVLLTERATGAILVEMPTSFVLPTDIDVPAIHGANISGSPLSGSIAISAAIDRAKTTPQFEVMGSELRGKTGRYAIEVIVKESGTYVSRPITVETDGPLKGRPIVNVRNAEIYGVRLINKSDIEAAVDLRIDGINCFAFSESKAASHWLVAPRSHLDILGWHRDEMRVIEFKVESNFPDTAAGKLKLIPSESIGMITAAFSAAWTLEATPPEDESLVSRGTGFGEEIEFQNIKVKRNIGKVRDVLSLRYEKKRG